MGFSNIYASFLFCAINVLTLFLLDLAASQIDSSLKPIFASSFTDFPYNTGVFLAIAFAQMVAAITVLISFIILDLIYLVLYFWFIKGLLKKLEIDRLWFKLVSKFGAVAFGFGNALMFALMATFLLSPIADATGGHKDFSNNNTVKLVRDFNKFVPHAVTDSSFTVSLQEFTNLLNAPNDPSAFFNREFLDQLKNEDNPAVKEAVVDYYEKNKDKFDSEKDQIQKMSCEDRQAVYDDFKAMFPNKKDTLADLEKTLDLPCSSSLSVFNPHNSYTVLFSI